MTISSIDDISATLLLIIASTIMYFVALSLKDLENVKNNLKHMDLLDDASNMFAKAIPYSLLEVFPDEFFTDIWVNPGVLKALGGMGLYVVTCVDDIPTLYYLFLGCRDFRKVAIEISGISEIKFEILTVIQEKNSNKNIDQLSQRICNKKKCTKTQFIEAFEALMKNNYIQKIENNIAITENGIEYLHEKQKHPILKAARSLVNASQKSTTTSVEKK